MQIFAYSFCIQILLNAFSQGVNEVSSFLFLALLSERPSIFANIKHVSN